MMGWAATDVVGLWGGTGYELVHSLMKADEMMIPMPFSSTLSMVQRTYPSHLGRRAI